jgi:hypothetical protein
MTISLESQLLHWIEEERERLTPGQPEAPVVIGDLLTEMPTQSTSSLVDRATFFRLVFQLERRHFVVVLDKAGRHIALDERLLDSSKDDGAPPHAVIITADGRKELERLRKLLA